MELTYLVCCLCELRRIPRIGFLFGINKKDFSRSPRYYQNVLHFFARGFYLLLYLGGRSFVSERFFESICFILLVIYFSFQMRNARLVRGKAIKREIDQKIGNGLRSADYYHEWLHFSGTVGITTMFFSGVVTEKYPVLSIIFVVISFFLGIVSSEVMFKREQSIYHGK